MEPEDSLLFHRSPLYNVDTVVYLYAVLSKQFLWRWFFGLCPLSIEVAQKLVNWNNMEWIILKIAVFWVVAPHRLV
jgi:hypothetical protein